MTDREFFMKTVAEELPRFDRVVKALPADKLYYKPHPQSRSAMELAAALAIDAISFAPILKSGVFDVTSAHPSSARVDEVNKAITDGLNEAKTITGTMTETDWASEAKMTMGGKEEWKTTKGNMALGFLLDMIHHRGQLSVYIRPMGGKVPSIYGPSGDNKA